jgi:3D (Asp-Asp-Asp) domain-containing protein
MGTAQLVRLDNDSPFGALLFVSTLNHVDTYTDARKIDVIQSALAQALQLAYYAGMTRIATTVLKGGWRLDIATAYGAMLTVYQRTGFALAGRHLDVHLHDTNEFEVLSSLNVHTHPSGPILLF